MKSNRRDFLKLTAMTGIGLANAGFMPVFVFNQKSKRTTNKVIVDNAVAKLQDGRVVSTPFWRVESGVEGPSLLLIAAQHGNEMQGAEVAKRLQEICVTKLIAGSVWLLPMANILAIRSRRHSFDLGPEQNSRMSEGLNNMQQTWPGDPEGNDTERLAYSIDKAVVSHCSHAVDMHCWEHVKAAETLIENDNEVSMAMGRVTTTRFVSYRKGSVPEVNKMMIRQLIRKRGGSSIVMELSGQFQMQERQVLTGLSSMINIAKLLHMIEGPPELIKGPRVVHSPENSHEVPAPGTGIFMPGMQKDGTTTLIPGDPVEKGQILGHIIREEDLENIPVVAQVSGYLWQFGLCHWNMCDASLPALHPYTEEGEIISVIVST